MNEIFPNIYKWFDSFFGSQLSDYLWGYNCQTQIYGNNIVYNQIGLLALGISFLFVFAYYYWPLNHPRFNRWWSWLIILLSSSFINLIIGFSITLRDFNNGNIGDCLMYTRDENKLIISNLISWADCFMFGVANFIVSAFIFIFFTFILKWGSRNAKYSPFIKF